jgi:hypothetical protein
MRTGRRLLAIALSGLTGSLLGASLLHEARPVTRSAVSPSQTGTTPVRSSAAEAMIDVESEAAPGSGTEAALVSIGSKLLRARQLAEENAALEAELVEHASTEPPSALRVRLERLLLDRPELAPSVAHAFLRLEDRERVFALSRALVTCGEDPEVRPTLLAAARDGAPAQRESALLALAPDVESLALARSALADAEAAPTVRAAGAFALARGFEALSDPERRAALADARSLAEASDERVRAEALQLLARAASPEDADLASRALDDGSSGSEVALAAAHLALATGKSPDDVARALAGHPDRMCALAASTLTNRRRTP